MLAQQIAARPPRRAVLPRVRAVQIRPYAILSDRSGPVSRPRPRRGTGGVMGAASERLPRDGTWSDGEGHIWSSGTRGAPPLPRAPLRVALARGHTRRPEG